MEKITLTIEIEVNDEGQYNAYMGDDCGGSGIELTNGKSASEVVSNLAAYMVQTIEDYLAE